MNQLNINVDLRSHLNFLKSSILQQLELLIDDRELFSIESIELKYNPKNSMTEGYRSKHYLKNIDTYSILIKASINNVYHNLEVVSKNTNETLSFRVESPFNETILFHKRGKMFRNNEININLLDPVSTFVYGVFKTKIDNFINIKLSEERQREQSRQKLNSILELAEGSVTGQSYCNSIDLTSSNGAASFRGIITDSEFRFNANLENLTAEQAIAIAKIINQ